MSTAYSETFTSRSSPLMCNTVPAGPPSPPRFLNSTDDLITRCGILPSYDDFVRPFIKPTSDVHLDHDDKGKGKEVPTAEHLDQDGAPKKKRKFEHSYKSFLTDIPGL